MSMRQFIGGVAVAVIVLGIVLMSITVHASAGGHNFACGNGWQPDTYEASHQADVDRFSTVLAPAYGLYGTTFGGDTTTYAPACQDATDARRWVGLPLMGFGLVGVLGAVLIRGNRPQ